MECYKISCKNIPNIFFEEKNVAKDHFRQFGRIKKMVFKPKSRICTVEYASKESVQKAMDFGCKYGNHIFEIMREIPLEISRKMKKDDPEWLPDPDVLEELNAMCGGPSTGLSKIYNLRPEVMDMDTKENHKNASKRQWPALEINKPAKTLKSSITLTSVSEEHQELIDLIKKPANNIDDKYKILDARDKLIRFLLKKEGNKSGATKGTCPDMCPEKERLLRVIQHQVSIYEQDSSKEMNEALAVKQYSRSSADQEASLPHELRSVTILQMTMSYLIHKIMNLGDTPDVNVGDWYHFLWDRTRSIRKDITQQELCSQGSVTLVEQCARFHIHCSARLVAEEPSVFDQKINTENLTKCLQTLKYMYNDLRLKGEECPNEAEFRAYIILLNLNDANFMWEVQKLQTVIKKSQEVKTAIEIYSALDKNNFIKFFKLVKSSSYLNACILMRYFMQVRIRAITILLKCYTPRITKVLYPLDKLTANLAFESVSHTIEFLQNCGLTINTSRTGVILDKNLFTTPDFTYASLDRSINVVESKRNNFSVGQIICQGRLPPTDFENHIPQNSFRENNILNLDQHQELKDLVEMDKPAHKIINKIDRPKNTPLATNTIKPKNPYVYIKDTQEGLSPKHSKFEETERLTQTKLPEGIRLPVTSSIFALDNRRKTESKTSFSKNIFGGQSLQNIPPPDTLKQEEFSKDRKLSQNNSKNLFEKNPESNNTAFATSIKSSQSLFGSNNLFGRSSVISKPNIFGQINQDKKNEGDDLSIFGNKKAVYINQENNEKTEALFNVSPKIEKDFSEIKWDLDSPKPCENDPNTVEDIFFKSSNTQANDLIKNVIPKNVGGFPFPNFSFSQLDSDKNKFNIISVKVLSEKDKIGKQIQKELKKDVENQEEKDRIKKLDMELEQKRRQQEAERKLQDAQRIKALNEKKLEEIKIVVNELIPEMLERVEEKIRIEKVEEMRKKSQRRILMQAFKIWRNSVLKIKRKRKAIACSPIWACTRSPHEEASELKMVSQNLALQNIKRYKYGRSITLKCKETKIVKKIDFKKLANVISKRYCESGSKFVKEIFWKCVISLPGISEMPEGREIIEESLQRCIEWKTSNGESILLEQLNLSNSQSVKFCIEKQTDLRVRHSDANGFIFIAKNYNQALCRRILENIKDFGVFVPVPIVIILQEKPPNAMNLPTLMKEGIISNYLILVDSFNQEKIISNVDNSLSFLLKNADIPPSLQLDTMKAFLNKNLCTEIWKKANSFSKWNSVYKNCLKNPNVVIRLYNEAIARLRNLILNKKCYELANFPSVFKELMSSQIPDCLPCDYKYFPEFCKEDSYLNCLSDILKYMELEPIKSWPPENEIHLQNLCLEYVSQSFENPQRPFYKILSVFSKYIESYSFCEIENVVWTDIIEILAAEKINQCDFYLEDTEYFNKSVFNQFIVIYDPEALSKYSKSDWFYVNNPIVTENIAENAYMPFEEERHSYNMTNEEVDDVISKAKSKLQNLDHTEKKNEIKEFNNLLNDLEESLFVNKRINESLNLKLMSIIEEN